MGDSKHTPGPYTAYPAKSGCGDIGIKAPSKRNIIAEFFADMDYDGEQAREECAANAFLFLGAPDLLQALKDLRRAYVNLLEIGRDRIMALGGDCDPVDVMEAGDPALKTCDAAIAKAEGRT